MRKHVSRLIDHISIRYYAFIIAVAGIWTWRKVHRDAPMPRRKLLELAEIISALCYGPILLALVLGGIWR